MLSPRSLKFVNGIPPITPDKASAVNVAPRVAEAVVANALECFY
jgi:hypothetical protein